MENHSLKKQQPNQKSEYYSLLSLETSDYYFWKKAELIPPELEADLDNLSIKIVLEKPEIVPYLSLEAESLKLFMPSGLSMGLDFSEPKYQRRFKPNSDLLCRACGWHLGLRHVWDLTAGLGGDAVLLSQAGFKVRAFERNKYLVALLREAHRQLGALASLSFEFADAESFLSLPTAERPEVLYYDPMYPAKRKTALPSKEMQILRELNGTSGESRSLLEKAINFATKRVVVKRPLRAPPIIEKPTAVVEGKLVRYDIYVAH